jgi:hypothetical protein
MRCLKKTVVDSVSLVLKHSMWLALVAETVIRRIPELPVHTLQQDQDQFNHQEAFILQIQTGLGHLAQELHPACKTV